MSEGRTYTVRGKKFCLNSGTVPHPSELRGGVVREAHRTATRARCRECGREVAVTKYGLISHHGPRSRGAT